VLAGLEAHRRPTWREAWTVTPAGRELARSSASRKRKRTAEALLEVAAPELAAALQVGDPNLGHWWARVTRLQRTVLAAALQVGDPNLGHWWARVTRLQRTVRATTARRERRQRARATA
jgi:hypothetical protein